MTVPTKRLPFPTDSLKLVHVTWEDSARCGSWETFEELRGEHVIEMRSVGWVLKDDDQYLVLGPHVGSSPPQACGTLVIPKRSIVKVVKLKGPS